MVEPNVKVDPRVGVKDGESLESGFRQYRGALSILVKLLGAGGCLFFMLYLGGAFAYFGVFFFPNQYNAIFMAIVLVLTFLLVPASKKAPKRRLPWYEIPPILGSLAGSIYIIVNAFRLSFYGSISSTPGETALGLITIVLLIEAVRRSFGWSMVIIAVAFLLYAKFGYLLPGPLSVYYFSWSDVIADMYLSRQGIFGSLTDISSSIIIAFITFGVFFVAAGGGEIFLKLALAVAGRMRGGPAKAAIVGSTLFGTISGSSAANAAVIGSITIPLMKQTGYKPAYAGAIEAVASSGGMIMPPVMGALAFVMAQILGVPYGRIATIAIVPGLLYYLSLFVQVDLQAAKEGLRGLPREQLPSFKATIKQGWEFAIPLLLLLDLMFVVRYPAVIAAIYSIVALIAISMFRKQHRIKLKQFIDSLERGLRDTLSVANIIALAGVIMATLTVTGLGPKLSAGLVTLFGGSMILLVIAAGITVYIMGMGVSLIASYILITSLVSPALLSAGLPLIVSHFFVFYLSAATYFTPPYCPTAFITAAIAGAPPFRVGFQAMRLGIVCFLVPMIIVFNPALVLVGEVWDVVWAIATASLAIYGLSVGMEGYLFRHLNWMERVLFFAGSVMVVITNPITRFTGVGLLAATVLWQWLSLRQRASSPTKAV